MKQGEGAGWRERERCSHLAMPTWHTIQGEEPPHLPADRRVFFFPTDVAARPALQVPQKWHIFQCPSARATPYPGPSFMHTLTETSPAIVCMRVYPRFIPQRSFSSPFLYTRTRSCVRDTHAQDRSRTHAQTLSPDAPSDLLTFLSHASNKTSLTHEQHKPTLSPDAPSDLLTKVTLAPPTHPSLLPSLPPHTHTHSDTNTAVLPPYRSTHRGVISSAQTKLFVLLGGRKSSKGGRGGGGGKKRGRQQSFGKVSL